MRKRIYINFLGLILLCSMLLSITVSLIFYNTIRNQEINNIKDTAVLVSELLDKGLGNINDEISRDRSEYISRFYDYMSDSRDTLHITVIAPDGTVLLDNKAIASALDNHSNIEEFQQAIETGSGSPERYLGPMGNTSYYYSVKLSDGNVLSISKVMSNILDVTFTILPIAFIVTALTLLAANFITRRLTRNIVLSLSNIDFDGDNPLVYDELLPYVKKIDQQRQEFERQITTLKNRADTIEVVTGNMKEGLILIDQNGLILTANQSMMEIFGEIDMTKKNILHVYRKLEFRKAVKQCISGVSAEITFEHEGKTYNVFFSPVYDDIEISGAVILFVDITERYIAEKHRREFSANVSHELKTPLTSISALSEIIENGMAKEEDMKSFAAKISDNTKRLINIVDDIIRLSEFDEGKLNRDHSDFDLIELAKSVVNVLQYKANEKHVTISIVGKRLRINSNKRMIDELLYNLIDNGINYNKDGGQVTVTLAKENGMIKISVSDTGIGIPAEHQNRVFERFYRVDKSRSKKTGGTGLGLSIVKHIAEHLGGTVQIASTVGVGTTIVCYVQD